MPWDTPGGKRGTEGRERALEPEREQADHGGNDREHGGNQLDKNHQGEGGNQGQQGETQNQRDPFNGPGQDFKHTPSPHRIKFRIITRPTATAKNRAITTFRARGKAPQRSSMKIKTGWMPVTNLMSKPICPPPQRGQIHRRRSRYRH